MSGWKNTELNAKLAAPVLVLIPLGAGLAVGWIVASGTYQPEFFRTAAEIIPILLLALVVDMRSLTLDLSSITGPKAKGLTDAIQRYGEFVFSVTTFAATALGVLIVIVGEIISLLVIANGMPSGKWQQGLVLGSCFTALALVAIRGLSVKVSAEI